MSAGHARARAWRAGVWLAVGALSAFACLPAAAADAIAQAAASAGGALPAPAALPTLPAGAQVMPLAQSIRLAGNAARIAVFRAPQTAADLLDFLAQRNPRFHQLLVEPDRLTLIAEAAPCGQSVSVTPLAGGGSVGVLASVCAQAAEAAAAPAAPRADALAQPARDPETLALRDAPGARLMLDLSFAEAAGRVTQQVWAVAMSPTALARWLHAHLDAQHWQRDGVANTLAASAVGALVQRHRGGDTLAYVVAALPEGSGVWFRRREASARAAPRVDGSGAAAVAPAMASQVVTTRARATGAAAEVSAEELSR
ncbi:MAG: hypothetical protein REJ50_16665 [Bordetella sp.]|nr:hypothetical protein [Bordetella sp.]